MKDFLMIWVICFLVIAILITALVPHANIWITIVVAALLLALLCYWIMRLYERLEELDKKLETENPSAKEGSVDSNEENKSEL